MLSVVEDHVWDFVGVWSLLGVPKPCHGPEAMPWADGRNQWDDVIRIIAEVESTAPPEQAPGGRQQKSTSQPASQSAKVNQSTTPDR